MKKIIAAFALSLTLAASAHAASTETATTETPVVAEVVATDGFKIMEPASWNALLETPKDLGATFAFNPASAKFWMGMIDPKQHDKYHAAFMNPAQYAQMMNPAFYLQLMDVNAWMEWGDLTNYQGLIELDTYTFFLNPENYVHNMNYNYFTQAFTLDNYEAFLKAETYGLGKTEGGFNMLNPVSWVQQAQVAVTAITE